MSPAVTSEGSPPRIAIIGAGSRGNAYARSVKNNFAEAPAIVSAVVDPIAIKRAQLGKKYIWGLEKREARAHEAFDDWQKWIESEVTVRKKLHAGKALEEGEDRTDAVVICVLDELHIEVVMGLRDAGLFSGKTPLHVLCEKPLATTLDDVLRIYKAVTEPLQTNGNATNGATHEDHRSRPDSIFSICHVLRYSPHNMMLRDLVLEQKAVGDILSVEHVEPVGWWHFSHSYVRGNWRNSSTTAPSLLTKSCHDIDFLLWLLCSPPTSKPISYPPHLPSYISSAGVLNQFRKARKPIAAGNATNCLSCPIEPTCIYSAKKIYVERHLENGNSGWPVKIVAPEIEDVLTAKGVSGAREILLERLAEDYTEPTEETRKRGWYGRCVWESENDVCDDQTVMMEWHEDPLPTENGEQAASALEGRGMKSATFHMIAATEAQCERRGRIYGSSGEITYDSTTISVYDFASAQTTTHHPKLTGGGHGGGDDGLILQFTKAVDAVKNGHVAAQEAQKLHLGCTLEEVVRSHAMVWAAEEARRERKAVHWQTWWNRAVGS